MAGFEYAIGDLHGRSDLLDAALTAVEAHAGERAAAIILLGDYLDRGPDSRGVIERAMAGPRRAGDTLAAITGNHEDMLLNASEGQPGALSHWLWNGGEETLASYGARRRGDLSVIPQAHLHWCRNLPVIVRTEHRLYVHAGVAPDRGLDQQRREDLLWIREPFLSSRKDFGLHVAHGHTPTADVVLRPNRTGLDIGAYFSGRLAVGVFDPDVAGGPVEVLRVTARGASVHRVETQGSTPGLAAGRPLPL